MTANLDTRSVESPGATEIFITSTPQENAPIQDQAREIFTGISDVLRSRGASILQERIFSTQAAAETLRKARAQAYGEIDDGVTPSFLVAEEGSSGPIAGVQVHAVSGGGKPEVVQLDGNPCGRIFRSPRCSYLTLSYISDQQDQQAAAQARIMMQKGDAILRKYGVDFLSFFRGTTTLITCERSSSPSGAWSDPGPANQCQPAPVSGSARPMGATAQWT